MTKESWDRFIGTKKRTAVTHYSEGKKCLRCREFITNMNKSGLCFECKSLCLEPRSPAGESQKHKDLKRKAVEFLEGLGCRYIKVETKSTRWKPRARYDVTGVLNTNGRTQYIVVECGGSHKRKLANISGQLITLYIWPYHENEPYLYTADMNVCAVCGHQV